MTYIDILGQLGLTLELVQSEQNGTVHYKNKNGIRLILYSDGSFRVEAEQKTETKKK